MAYPTSNAVSYSIEIFQLYLLFLVQFPRHIEGSDASNVAAVNAVCLPVCLCLGQNQHCLQACDHNVFELNLLMYETT